MKILNDFESEYVVFIGKKPHIGLYRFTYGSKYKLIRNSAGNDVIISDNSLNFVFSNSTITASRLQFVELDVWREMQLNKII